MKRPIKHRAYLVDIEGVLVRDKRYQPVPGSICWLNELIEQGEPYCLVSNNTTHAPDELIDLLIKAGYMVRRENLVTALELAILWLKEQEYKTLMWLGAPRLREYWLAAGFELVSAGPCDAVVAGVNPNLTVADLDQALQPVIDGARLVCLHQNPFYLDDQGSRRLGPGAWSAALATICDPSNVVTIGKPSEIIYHEALKRVGVKPEEALFISDDPIADLVTAGKLGIATAFVLSGKYEDHSVLGRMAQEDWPDIICACPADLRVE